MTAIDLFLQNNLKKFGLNPIEWKVRRLEEATYKIAHVDDHDFYFVGKIDVTQKAPTWNTIVLASF